MDRKQRKRKDRDEELDSDGDGDGEPEKKPRKKAGKKAPKLSKETNPAKKRAKFEQEAVVLMQDEDEPSSTVLANLAARALVHSATKSDDFVSTHVVGVCDLAALRYLISCIKPLASFEERIQWRTGIERAVLSWWKPGIEALLGYCSRLSERKPAPTAADVLERNEMLQDFGSAFVHLYRSNSEAADLVEAAELLLSHGVVFANKPAKATVWSESGDDRELERTTLLEAAVQARDLGMVSWCLKKGGCSANEKGVWLAADDLSHAPTVLFLSRHVSATNLASRISVRAKRVAERAETDQRLRLLLRCFDLRLVAGSTTTKASATERSISKVLDETLAEAVASAEEVKLAGASDSDVVAASLVGLLVEHGAQFPRRPHECGSACDRRTADLRSRLRKESADKAPYNAQKRRSHAEKRREACPKMCQLLGIEVPAETVPVTHEKVAVYREALRSHYVPKLAQLLQRKVPVSDLAHEIASYLVPRAPKKPVRTGTGAL